MDNKHYLQYVYFPLFVSLVFGILSVMFTPFKSQASFIQNEQCLQAVEYIYGLRSNDAKEILKVERKRDPLNLYAVYLEQYCDAFDLLISGNEEEFKKFKKKYKERTKYIDSNSSKNEPWKDLILAEMEFQYGLFLIKFGKFFKGASNCIGGYRKVKRNHEKYPDFIPNLKLTGTTNVILSNIPAGPKWIFELLGMSGNEEEGIAQLEKYFEQVKNKKGTQTEAVVLMGFTYRTISEEYALDFLKNLNPEVFNNPLASYVYAITLHRTGFNDKAIDILSSIDRNKMQLPLIDIDYWLGKLKLFRLDDDAFELLENYYKVQESDDYKKEVAGYISFYYLTNNNFNNYHLWRHKVMGTGSDTRERDKKAMIVCAYNYQEFQGIVKAHLLLNGAYYKRAKEELEVIDLSKLSGSYFETEYYYLLGCSLMGSNKLNEAIQNFSKAIDTAFDTNHFLLKPAMQKQALAYEKMMRFNDALKKYKETLNSKSENNSFSKHAEKEAQDGLKRIKNH